MTYQLFILFQEKIVCEFNHELPELEPDTIIGATQTSGVLQYLMKWLALSLLTLNEIN